MSNLSNHNHFFTEENSPVPLVPPDDAWAAMQVKLDRQLPGKKERRGLLWMSPVGCGLLLLLLAVGGYWLWPTADRQQRADQSSQVYSADSIGTKQNTAPSLPAPAGNEDRKVLPDRLLITDTQKVSLPAGEASRPGMAPVTARQPFIAEKKRSSTGRRATDHIHQQPVLSAEPGLYNKTLFPSPGSAGATGVEENSLRFTQVAGVHFHAPIRVQPFFSPRPGWLPEERSSKDSSGNKPAHRITFAAGLQAELPVSFYGGYAYFSGPNGRDQFFPFIPGVWASISRKKHRLTGDFKPFSNAQLPNKVFYTGTFITSDGTVYRGQHTVLKVFGSQFGLHYSYQLSPRWWVGAGLTGSVWRKGLIGVTHPVDSMGSRGRKYGFEQPELDELQSFQLGAALHVAYGKKAWQGTLHLESPFQSTVKGVPVPVWMRFGVRWRFWQSKAASSTPPSPPQTASP